MFSCFVFTIDSLSLWVVKLLFHQVVVWRGRKSTGQFTSFTQPPFEEASFRLLPRQGDQQSLVQRHREQILTTPLGRTPGFSRRWKRSAANPCSAQPGTAVPHMC